MAGDWIKFETGTPDKPEVWEIAAIVGIDPDAVVGKLLRIWAWFDEHTEDGHAPSVTKVLLDREAGVDGFCDAVITAGWMHEKNRKISLSNFYKHNGATAKTRASSAKRSANYRATGGRNSHAPGVTEVSPKEDRDIDINNKKKNARTRKPAPLDYSSWPQMPGDQTLRDWLAMRKRIKADVTQTVINTFATEMHKAVQGGDSVDDCLAECVTRNWRGFKYQWILNERVKNNAHQRPFAPRGDRSAAADEKLANYFAECDEQEAHRGGLENPL